MQKKQQVRMGVITVAGIGTRFLPATKAMPKEMLPVLDKPVVQYIVEEMVASGITKIVFITSANKRAIEDHFDRNHDFENFLKKQGKYDRIQPLVELAEKIEFFYTRQSAPKGNGHALLCAKTILGDEPFVFSDGDSIIDSKTPVVKQLLKTFYKKKASVIGVQRLSNPEEMIKYGNVYGKRTRDARTFRVDHFQEKPPLDQVSPEGLIVGGMRYVFTKDIWPMLEKQGEGRDGEIWLSDAANALAKKKPFYAYEYEGIYFDTGDKVALLKTAIHFAMKDEKLRSQIMKLF